jgi:hypothetical protein
MNETDVKEIFLKAEETYKELKKLTLSQESFFDENYVKIEPKLEELNIENNNLNDFIINFFNIYNKNFSTREDGTFYCGTSKRRSIGDIYRISINFFPKCSILDILQILYDICESKSIELCTLICPTIKKRVYFISSYYGTTTSINLINEFSVVKSNFTSPYYYAGHAGWNEQIGHTIDEFGLKSNDYVNLFKNKEKKEYV